jgi:hypothetical protein
MSDFHIFRASGDSCPTCLALDGQKVPPGFSPHGGCQCQTVPPEKVVECEWNFVSTGTTRIGPGSYDVQFGYEVWVKCPDGRILGSSGQYDCSPHTAPNTDFFVVGDLFRAEVEAVAQQLCASCAPAKDSEFLCC